jgi:GNAT superfamily N-acetyltransferase
MTSDIQHASAVSEHVAAAFAGPITLMPGDMQWIDTLRDGTSVLIRAIRDDDAELERRFIERLSPQSRRYRFLGTIKSPDANLLRHLTHVNHVSEIAFIALISDGTHDCEIGVSRYYASRDGTSCECAVAVSDEWQHQGLATLLMNHLIDVARRHGISHMSSMDAPDNQAMRELAAHLGFVRSQDPDDPKQVLHTLILNAGPV